VIADSSIFDSVIGGYWVALVLKAAVVLGVFLIVPLAVGYMEHKVLAHMQAR
jgi:NADH-quinone oxidoreductase subunit H